LRLHWSTTVSMVWYRSAENIGATGAYGRSPSRKSSSSCLCHTAPGIHHAHSGLGGEIRGHNLLRKNSSNFYQLNMIDIE